LPSAALAQEGSPFRPTRQSAPLQEAGIHGVARLCAAWRPALVFVIGAGLYVWAGLPVQATTKDAPGFDRYQVILDRKPFGEVVELAAASSAPTGAAALVSAIAQKMRVTAIVEEAGVTSVGIVNTENKKSYFLSQGEKEDDIEFVRAEGSGKQVLLRIQGVETSLTLDESAPVAAPSAEARRAVLLSRLSPPDTFRQTVTPPMDFGMTNGLDAFHATILGGGDGSPQARARAEQLKARMAQVRLAMEQAARGVPPASSARPGGLVGQQLKELDARESRVNDRIQEEARKGPRFDARGRQLTITVDSDTGEVSHE
jgi:hypothetical protein